MKGPPPPECPVCGADSTGIDAAGNRQNEAIQLMLYERTRQDAKWGEQNHDAEMWLVILGEEYGEACQAALADAFGRKNQKEKKSSQLRDEIVQVAAVALAILEWMNRSGYGR